MKKICFFKKAVSVFFAACLVVSSFPLRFSAANATAKTTDYLNLREGAGTNTKVILTLSKNATVSILDNSDAEWAKVETSSGKTGYCFKQYLSFSSSSGQTSSSSSTLTAATTANLNLRQESSLSGKILLVLAKGTTVTVLDHSNSSWFKVQTKSGTQGWCSRQYLSVSGSDSSEESDSVSDSATAKTTDYLNLRTGAGLNNPVILTMSKGLAVTVLDSSNSGWVQVRTPSGTQGWCSRQYLTMTEDADTADKTNSSSSSTVSSVSSKASSAASSEPAEDSDQLDENDEDTEFAEFTAATVTADVLRLREQANTTSKILDHLLYGTNLQILSAPASGWAKVETPTGKTGYVSTDYVKMSTSSSKDTTQEDTAAEDTTISSEEETESESSSGIQASAVSLSSGAQTVPQGKTLYLKATTNPSNADVSWTSSNESVATVVNGYVTAIAKGSAVVTATSGDATASCSVTVTDAEPIRTAYVSPNIVGPGEDMTFIAVTDSSRDGVRFYVTKPNGKTSVIDAVSSTSETTNGLTTKVWKATSSFDDSGSYTVEAVSRAGGDYSSDGFTTSAYITTQNDKSKTTSEERRVSDEMLQLIAKWEGYRACVYTDTLSSSQVPTIGYGYTLGSNAQFYNGVSKTEAWSILVNRINNSSYTSELNKMIQNNDFLMNQYQADCLISFAYNVGSGYFNSKTEMDFVRIMKNAVRPPIFSSGHSYEATITKDTLVRDNSGVLSDSIATVKKGTSVTVTDSDFSDKDDAWYKVELPDDTVGWVNSGYVSLENADHLIHDLSYTNAYAFGTELIRWNQAGGKFYTGLFYRRLGEANVYNYGDYGALRYNKYGYGYPSAAASLQ